MAAADTTFRILTLGCKVNAYESEQYAEQLIREGLIQTDEENADVFIVNSCAVTNVAASKCRQRIHALRRDFPDSLIAVVGCYVQVAREDLSVFDDCDVVVGSFDKSSLVPMILKSLKDHRKYAAVSEENDPKFETGFIESFQQTRAYMKIEDGCNQFCSYCVIPYARGRERFMSSKDALQQASALVSKDHQELVLTGIHTGRWKEDGHDLAWLMRELLNRTEGLKRLRLSSIEMNEVSDDLIRLMKEDDRVARHLHIPLQAGSDAILKAMRRPYTFEEYKARIEYIRKEVPGVSVSSDIITGFPGETGELFEESVRNIRDAKLSFLHVFPFSVRKGTRAETMPNHVDGGTKKARVRRLTNLSHELYNGFMKTKLQSFSSVYIEQKITGMWFGHSSDYLPVYVKSDLDLKGKFVDVRLISVGRDGMIGELI